ncbi:MAG: winged helix-turn-helix transcriptional regulator [Bacillota bacterium]|nr:winged helix-turn-helix transcriptional regulator [Bacillota bacterium]
MIGVTMVHEYELLTYLQQNEEITQRQISRGTGLSLGAVNLLLKKMVRKGLVKIERLTPRTVRYILTPRGLEEKARLAYRYMRDSYRQIRRVNRALDEALGGQIAGNGYKVVLCGPADEIREMISGHLQRSNITCESYSDPQDLKRDAIDNNSLVITWREEEEERLDNSLNTVNIMRLV